jgi:peptidoglycan/LPS O-acetylase OafA/YrhL
LLATVCALGGFAHALYSNPPAEIWLPERILDQGLGLLRVVWWGIPSGALVLASLWWSDSAKQSPKVQPSGLWLALLALGDASYALYLIHPFVIAPIQYLFPAIPWGVDILVAGAVVVSCGAAIVVHRLVEQPLLAELRGTRNRPGTANVRAAPNVHA